MRSWNQKWIVILLPSINKAGNCICIKIRQYVNSIYFIYKIHSDAVTEYIHSCTVVKYFCFILCSTPLNFKVNLSPHYKLKAVQSYLCLIYMTSPCTNKNDQVLTCLTTKPTKSSWVIFICNLHTLYSLQLHLQVQDLNTGSEQRCDQYTCSRPGTHLRPGSRWRSKGSSSRSWQDCGRPSVRAGRGDCRPVYTHTTPSLPPTHHPWLRQKKKNTQNMQVNISKNWFCV